MALGYSIKARGAIGDFWVKIVDFTLDAAYAAGGYALSAQSLGLGQNGTILGVIPMTSAGFIPEFIPATGKLAIRDASGGVGAVTPEVANNLAGLNGLVIRALVLGRGSPG